MPKYISGQSGNECLPEGEYPFKIVSSRLTTSQKGNEMIELILDVGENGNSTKVFDYLVFDGKSFSSGKIDQLRTSIGEIILPNEEINVEPSDLLGREGHGHFVIEIWKDKKVNKIGSYLEPQDELPGLGKTAPKPTKPF